MVKTIAWHSECSEVTAEDGKKTITYSDELGRKILSKSQLAISPTTGHSGFMPL